MVDERLKAHDSLTLYGLPEDELKLAVRAWLERGDRSVAEATCHEIRQVLREAKVPEARHLDDHVRMAVLERDQAKQLEYRYKLTLAAIVQLPEDYPAKELPIRAIKLAREALGAGP